MGLLDLPDGFSVPDRDTIVQRHKRDQLLLNPDADVTSGQPDMDARLAADLVLPIYSDASLIAQGINEDDATGPRLDRVGGRIGLPRGKARGAGGYGSVSAATGGGTLVEGTEVQNKQTKLRYEIAETKHRLDGEHIRLRGRDTGPSTDLPPGTVLTITNPPPGIGQQLTVVEQSGGRGLTGGANDESDPAYLARIRDHKQNPPAGDNDAEFVDAIMLTPDVAFERVFTYPGAEGPGTSAFACTVLAPVVGASRIPTDSQMTAANEWIKAQMPAVHNYFPTVQIATDLTLAFQISWAVGGWADATPWPEQYADGVEVVSATSPTVFVLSGSGDSPVAGQTLGFWDAPKLTFRRKRIASVAGVGPWTITCSTQNGASDTTYTPVAGQLASPWSDNLAKAPAPVLAYMATLGPGELFAPNDIPNEEGRRRIREPRAPKAWPYATTNKVTVDLSTIPEVQDATALEGVGVTVSPGFPPHQYELGDLAFFSR